MADITKGRLRRSAIPRALLCAVSFALATDAPGQHVVEATPTLEAERLGSDERIVLDGYLSDSVWLRAKPATNFRQQVRGVNYFCVRQI